MPTIRALPVLHGVSHLTAVDGTLGIRRVRHTTVPDQAGDVGTVKAGNATCPLPSPVGERPPSDGRRSTESHARAELRTGWRCRGARQANGIQGGEARAVDEARRDLHAIVGEFRGLRSRAAVSSIVPSRSVPVAREVCCRSPRSTLGRRSSGSKGHGGGCAVLRSRLRTSTSSDSIASVGERLCSFRGSTPIQQRKANIPTWLYLHPLLAQQTLAAFASKSRQYWQSYIVCRCVGEETPSQT